MQKINIHNFSSFIKYGMEKIPGIVIKNGLIAIKFPCRAPEKSNKQEDNLWITNKQNNGSMYVRQKKKKKYNIL
jgi:hypothetical protein